MANLFLSHIILLNCPVRFITIRQGGEMEVLMEHDMRSVSRERINENYLRRMLRDDARYAAHNQARTSRGACATERGVLACEMMGDGYNEVGNKKPLAMVYAEKQRFGDLYDKKSALQRGTLFKELDFPFLGYKE